MCNDTLVRSLSTFTHVHFRNSVQWRNRKWPWFNRGMKSKTIGEDAPNAKYVRRTWSGRRKCDGRSVDDDVTNREANEKVLEFI